MALRSLLDGTAALAALAIHWRTSCSSASRPRALMHACVASRPRQKKGVGTCQWIRATSTAQLAPRKPSDASQTGMYPAVPVYSSWYASQSQVAHEPHHMAHSAPQAHQLRISRASVDGSARGSNERYQTKYWAVQTLLKVTNASVEASMQKGRSSANRTVMSSKSIAEMKRGARASTASTMRPTGPSSPLRVARSVG
eukprot:scaffold167447_cov33-Tisochrysis_lutea.AAC.3